MKKVRTNTGRSHINVKRRADGKPGVILAQRGETVLMSRDEWLQVRAYADEIMGTGSQAR